MEVDEGVKAPVTRLRRRMSVEQSEESKSPAKLNTPTKKRVGRRVAKPDLDLIDENNANNNTTKTSTKKAPVKEVIDSIEEKPVTPSRRSTRIKSNTSIVSDIASGIDSPRAKRASRRTSQIGSDSEAPPTPVRQTRRTRKDSISSIEKVEIQPSTKPTIQISEMILEEPESNSNKSTNSEKNTSTGNVRKSPRLREKMKQNASTNEKEITPDGNDKPTDEIKLNTSLNKSLEASNSKEHERKEEETAINIPQNNRHSLMTSNLLNNLVTEVNKNNLHLNKSTSALETKCNGNKKRNRTKSWTTVTVSNDSNFNSDNEGLRKNNNDETQLPLVKINKFNSGDALNTTIDKDKVNKSKNKENINSFVEGDISVDTSMTNMSNKSMDKKNEEKSETFLLNQSNNEKNNLIVTNKLFETEPSCDIQTVVYIDEDSDTNSGKVGIQNRHEHEDQCVPVIQHSDQLEKDISQFPVIAQKNDSIKANLSKNANIMNESCEPMDVDETIPENSLIPETKTHSILSSSPCVLLDKSETKEKQLNKSKRKSSISLNLNKSENENKSTLILSQLKDSSSGDINSVTKSPQIKQSMLSKTTDDLNATQENDINKRNLSLNYVTTSTPLQQKKLQKLGNINTSIIKSDNDTNNIKTKKNNSSKNNKISDDVDNESLSEEETSQNNNNEIIKNKSNFNNSLNKTKTDKEDLISENENDKNTSNDSKEDNKSLNNKSKKLASKISNASKKSVNKSFTSTDSDEEMTSNDESQESVYLMDEAEDAGESYESGDSQDENERQYLRENEIMEKGVTLTSDDDLSDDLDYEKDSFVVSSAEEDNELLNGTEDDLSMNDNELKMTTKSKKKYDERKKKEQKNASREMYESRHKLNVSNKSSTSEIGNTKRRKPQQISSSESEDENEIKSKKKNHRMRLDSSHEVSLREDNNEINISDKKRKRLSQSCCDENVINEKEITICNESLKEIDPLTMEVKEKHKTPQKANASIAFINTENDPNIESELTKTQTELDPLEDSMAEEDSLSGDNENIMQNYDSILEGLNKTSNIKSKKCDISLNVNKKIEKKKNTAIIDELNLTQIKSSKKNKQKESKNNFTGNKMAKPDIEHDSSPDSIDLHLLFSEDSNSSDNIQNTKNTSKTEDFIPLKRIEGKTNIRENTDTGNQVDIFGNLDVSYNKRNKKPKPETATNSDNTNENNESFFIDTEGVTTQCNNSLNKSSSKKNKKKLSLVNTDNLDLDYDEIIDKKDVSMVANKTGTNENSDSDCPIDVPFKKEKRNSKIEENLDEDGKDETDFAKDTCNKSIRKIPNSEKKKKNKMAESLNNIKPTENVCNLNISLSKTKKKKSSDEIIEDSNEKDKPEQVIDESMTKTPGSKKKKRISQTNVQEQDEEVVPIDKSFSTPSSISKKKKQLLFSPENDQIERKGDLSLDESKLKTPRSQKKKKLSLKSPEIEQPGDIPESSLNTSKIKTPGSQKKKKVSESEKEVINIFTPGSAESKGTNSNSSTGQNNSLTTEAELNDSKNTKKRKRKSSHTPPEETVLEDEINTANKLNESLVYSQKKKRKVSQNEKTITNTEPVLNENLGQSKIGKNKNFTEETESKVQNTEIKTKKRKERDDDEGNKISKVAKGNSFDTVHVPRLPTSIIKQLDDKPKQILTAKKPKLVSTTQFSVVEAKRRRNKPSNYLEESIYINDDEPENRKQKKVLQKPKVLPFVPTVLTSASGYTTNFKVNVLPTEMKFVAQSNTVSNFKEDFLFNKNIRRHGTYELYKRKRNIKISKF